jgi:phospholipase C
VPCIIVSPWTVGAYVASEVFDHTSQLRFLEQITGVTETNISRWRRESVGDLTSAFDFGHGGKAAPVLPDTNRDFNLAQYEARRSRSPFSPAPTSGSRRKRRVRGRRRASVGYNLDNVPPQRIEAGRASQGRSRSALSLTRASSAVISAVR